MTKQKYIILFAIITLAGINSVYAMNNNRKTELPKTIDAMNRCCTKVEETINTINKCSSKIDNSIKTTESTNKTIIAMIESIKERQENPSGQYK